MPQTPSTVLTFNATTRKSSRRSAKAPDTEKNDTSGVIRQVAAVIRQRASEGTSTGAAYHEGIARYCAEVLIPGIANEREALEIAICAVYRLGAEDVYSGAVTMP